MSHDQPDKNEPSEQRNASLDDGEIISARAYGRRALLRTVGATILAAGAAITSARRASADPSYGDFDSYDGAQSDGDSSKVSDPKDTDQSTTADSGDSDQRTFADPHWKTGDSDQGTLRDPKDSDETTYGDSKDSD